MTPSSNTSRIRIHLQCFLGPSLHGKWKGHLRNGDGVPKRVFATHGRDGEWYDIMSFLLYDGDVYFFDGLKV